MVIGMAGGPAGPAAAAPAFVFLKPGVTADRMLADDATCEKQAQATPRTAPSPVYANSVYGAAAAGALSGAIAGYHRGHVQQLFIAACMRDLGYARLEFTPAEAAELANLHGVPANKAWADAFFAKDWTDRFAAARRPVVLPLPKYVAEPGSVNGVRLHPADLAAASGEIGPDGVIPFRPRRTHAHRDPRQADGAGQSED